MSFGLHRKALPVVVTALAFVMTGCATFGYDDVFRNPPQGSYRYDVDRDVTRYVVQVDRHVRMSSRDERAIARYLRDRTYRLLDRTRPENRRFVYPFPRRDDRQMNSAQYEFWRDADRTIERSLPRTQARRYADVTRGRDYREHRRADRRETRGRKNRGRYDDRRYDNRRHDDRRDDGRRDDDDDDDRRRSGRDHDDDDDDRDDDDRWRYDRDEDDDDRWRHDRDDDDDDDNDDRDRRRRRDRDDDD